MERLVVFTDYANVEAAFQTQYIPLNHAHLLNYLSEGRFLVEAHIFVPIDPRNPTGRDAIIEQLWEHNYVVHSKVGMVANDTYRCDFDIEIVLEMMRTAEIVKPDIVVLVSGDKDFIPAVLELRRRGIRVEVAAIPYVNAAHEMQLKASGFIDLNRYAQARDHDATDDDENDADAMDGDDVQPPWETGEATITPNINNGGLGYAAATFNLD